MLGAVVFEPGVEFADGGYGVDSGFPGVVIGGSYGGEDDFDSAGAGDVGHGGEVVFDHLRGGGAGVAGDVVGAGEDEDGGGVEMDDVLLEADEHLRGGLAADAAVDVGLAGEEGSGVGLAAPAVGDGVSVKDDARLGGRRVRGGRRCRRRSGGVGASL